MDAPVLNPGAARRLSGLSRHARTIAWVLAVGGLLGAAAAYAWVTPAFNASSWPRVIAFRVMGVFGIATVFCWPSFQRRERRRTLVSLFLVAAAARLLLLPAAPSDDINRYLWEGRLINAGESPYSHTADAPAWQAYRDHYWESMNHHDKATAYPPLAQLTFAAIARVAYDPLAFKLVFLILDLTTVTGLLVLLHRRALPLQWAGFYAFNPIILVSFAAEGHFDILMICPLVWALVAAERGRAARAAGLCALAVGAKLVCAPVVPFLIGWRKPRAWFVFALVLALPTLPFAGDLLALAAGVVTFGAHAEFNGPLYDLLNRGLGLPYPAPKLILAAAFVALWIGLLIRQQRSSSVGGDHGGQPEPRPAPSASSARPEPVVDRQPAIVACLGALILFAPVVHLWYLTWVLPFTVLRPRLHWLMLSVSAGAYFFVWDNQRAGSWSLLPWQETLFWAPFLLALMYDLAITRFAVFRARTRPLPDASAFCVIVPCLRAERSLRGCLESLGRQTRPPAEVILACADPDLPTLDSAAYPFPVLCRQVPIGRGNQIHAAIAMATAPWVVVLHADSSLPPDALARLEQALRAAPQVVGGAFGQRFQPPSARTLPIEILNDARSLLGQMAFGDQVQFFRRDLARRFDLVPAQPLMEDVELSWRLRELGPTLHLGTNASSRASRWNDAPWLRRFWLVMRLFWRYHFARLHSHARAVALADDLYRRYYGQETGGKALASAIPSPPPSDP
ncbi:MAG: glycosyltransferase [Thiohalocapsa sp.]